MDLNDNGRFALGILDEEMRRRAREMNEQAERMRRDLELAKRATGFNQIGEALRETQQNLGTFAEGARRAAEVCRLSDAIPRSPDWVERIEASLPDFEMIEHPTYKTNELVAEMLGSQAEAAKLLVASVDVQTTALQEMQKGAEAQRRRGRWDSVRSWLALGVSTAVLMILVYANFLR